MSITIKRSTNFIGIALPLNIKIDGRKVEKVYHEEEKEIEIERPVVELGVSQLLTRTSRITVAEGEYIEIRPTLWRSLYFIIFIILLPIVVLTTYDVPYKILGFLGLIAYVLIAQYGFDHFKLEKVEFQEEKWF